MYIAHNSNHSGPAPSLGDVDLTGAHAMSQRALSRPLACGEGLIHYCDVVSAIVPRIEVAALQQRLANS